MMDSLTIRNSGWRCVRQRVYIFVVVWACLLSASSGQSQQPASATDSSSQPIAFSHRLHAGDLNIQCVFCHSWARRSAVAGLPAVGTCVGCHRWVKTKSPEMLKVDEYWAKKQPIVWKRIHQMDDYVHFSHRRHVAAGLNCQGCHGSVEKMERVEKIERMTMGWCVSCHEQRSAPLDCSTCHR